MNAVNQRTLGIVILILLGTLVIIINNDWFHCDKPKGISGQKCDVSSSCWL
jgi:hypothetical protein